MSKPTDIRIKSVKTDTERIAYRAPIKFGGRVVTDAVLVNVSLEVETVGGKHGGGFGSMPMGNVWAWPSNVVTPAQSLEAMLEFVKRLRAVVADYREAGHPLDITRELAEQHNAIAAEVIKKLGPGGADAEAGRAGRGQPFRSGDSRRLWQGAWRKFVQPARAGVSSTTTWRTI